MYRWISIFILFALCACTDAPNFSEVPELTYNGILENTFAQSIDVDTAFIQFTITDADGDIGANSDGDPSVFFTDEFDGFELQPFTLPEISDQGTGKGIKMEATILFRVIKNDLCCRYPDGTTGCVVNLNHPIDSIFYDVYVKDHAGHESNHVRVGPLYMICDQP